MNRCRHKRGPKALHKSSRPCGLIASVECPSLCEMHLFWVRFYGGRIPRPKTPLAYFSVEPIKSHVHGLLNTGYTHKEVASRLGVHLRELERILVRTDPLREDSADKWAVRLDLTPENVWPFEWTSSAALEMA